MLPGPEVELLPEALHVRDVRLAVLAQVLAVGVDHRRRVVVDARGLRVLLVHRDDEDHARLLGEVLHPLRGRAVRDQLGVAVVLGVLDLAEVRAVEQLLEEHHLRALLRRRRARPPRASGSSTPCRPSSSPAAAPLERSSASEALVHASCQPVGGAYTGRPRSRRPGEVTPGSKSAARRMRGSGDRTSSSSEIAMPAQPIAMPARTPIDPRERSGQEGAERVGDAVREGLQRRVDPTEDAVRDEALDERRFGDALDRLESVADELRDEDHERGNERPGPGRAASGRRRPRRQSRSRSAPGRARAA